MKALYLNLNKEWFDKIKSGEKTIEYREYKPYWINKLTGIEFDIIVFRNGYQKNAPEIKAEWLNTVIIENGMETDLRIDRPVFAIQFKIRE